MFERKMWRIDGGNASEGERWGLFVETMLQAPLACTLNHKIDNRTYSQAL